ncbi:MAG: hypothetical protein M3258_03470 [Thermoproteota archaeon]|nr:hypothetical protein [Thermoproteota archaeon]
MDHRHDVIMWSTVVIFVLTFAVLGLLLGFAALYNTNRQDRSPNTAIERGPTANQTAANQSLGAITGK